MKRDSIKHFGDVLHLFLDILGQNIISNLKQSKKMYSSKNVFPNQTGISLEFFTFEIWSYFPKPNWSWYGNGHH